MRVSSGVASETNEVFWSVVWGRLSPSRPKPSEAIVLLPVGSYTTGYEHLSSSNGNWPCQVIFLGSVLLACLVCYCWDLQLIRIIAMYIK